MSVTFAVAAIAGAGLAALLVLALRGRGVLAAWSAAFAGVLLVWTTADAAHELTGAPLWHAVDVTASPLTLPVGLHLAVAFAGRARPLRAALIAAWLWFGALAAASAVTLGGAPPLLGDGPWTAAFLAGIAAASALGARELLRVRREAGDAGGRARAGLLLVALPFAAVFGATDLVDTFVPAVPELAPLGVLGSSLATTAVALRWRLFGHDVSTAAAAQALVVGATAVAAYVVAALVLTSSTAALILVCAAVTAALVVAIRSLAGDAATERARRDELARLGRAAAQMAHDLNNPLAGIRGAADVLAEELRRGTTPNAELMELAAGIRDDADRVSRVVNEYRRFVRVEPEPVDVDVARWIAACAAAAARSAPAGVVVHATAVTQALRGRFDADLVTQVLENLARNAFEALEGRSGRVILAASPSDRAGRDGLTVRIEDDGPGMDSRTRARATDDFFTTKATGSGLGLAFARRVAEAHGGVLTLLPRAGGGTVAELWLPRPRPRGGVG